MSFSDVEISTPKPCPKLYTWALNPKPETPPKRGPRPFLFLSESRIGGGVVLGKRMLSTGLADTIAAYLLLGSGLVFKRSSRV